jgi:hypothetical protein
MADIFLPYEVLPDAKEWRVGKNYRTKMVVKQTGMSEQGANFNVVDATSLELRDKAKAHFLSDGGTYISRK